MRVAGAVALVTGASSGIGHATARRLAAAGARVLVAGRDPDRVATVAAELDGVPLAVDLSRPDAADELAHRALTAAGRVDILVNNAGVGWAGRFADTPADDIDRLVAVNLVAPLRLTRALLPTMRGSGHIVLVGSIAGRLGVAGEAAYSAVKAGLDALAGSLRLELSGSGTGVTLVIPGVIDTPFFERRGTPYRRGRPRPLPADRVATAIVDAVQGNRAEVYVPAWLRLPVAVRAVAPGAYRLLAGRLG